MKENKQTWKRIYLKGKKVWMATDIDGKPILKNRKVRIKYQLDKNHEYWVYEKGLETTDPIQLETIGPNREPRGEKNITSRPSRAPLEDKATKAAISIFTDGACSGNPGPSGIGAILYFGEHEKEISRHIGIATNNIAELEAIKTGLLEIKNRKLPVKIFTDSSYAYGVLSLGWKTRKNIDLVRSIKKLISTFSELTIFKVKGHAGLEGNEIANRLATQAVLKGNKKKAQQ